MVGAEVRIVGKTIVVGIEHTHGRGHDLLGTHAGQQTHVELPVETLRAEERLDGLSQSADVTLFLLLLRREILTLREITQSPDNDTGHENDATHLLEILSAFLPSVPQDGLASGKTIGRQLHDERHVGPRDEKSTEKPTYHHRHEDTHHVKRNHDGRTIFKSEERSRYHDVNRQPGRTAHHRQNEHRDQSAAPALNRSRGHDGRHVAAESHDQWDERLAVQAHLVHQFVHDESGASHIATVFHERDEEIEQQNLRQENDDSSYTGYDTIDEHRLDRAWGERLPEPRTELGNAGFDPVHRILPQSKSDLEHDVEQEEEDGETPVAMGDDRIEGVGEPIGIAGGTLLVVGFLQSPMNKTVFGIHEGRLTVYFHVGLERADRGNT